MFLSFILAPSFQLLYIILILLSCSNLPAIMIVHNCLCRVLYVSGEQTFRLRISAPSQCVGWITERDHIVRQVGAGASGAPAAGATTGGSTAAGTESHGGAAGSGATPTSYLDPEIASELTRRAHIRHVRHERQALRHAQAVSHRRATVQGTLDTSSETFFLLNGERKPTYGSSSSSSSSNPMLSSDFTTVSYPAAGTFLSYTRIPHSPLTYPSHIYSH